jgi:hypothetical protein
MLVTDPTVLAGYSFSSRQWRADGMVFSIEKDVRLSGRVGLWGRGGVM